MLEKDPRNCIAENWGPCYFWTHTSMFFTRSIFNGRLMPSLEASSSIPQEIIGGRKSQDTMHLALSKKLIAYVSNNRKLHTVITCAYVKNYYDRVVYPHASLCSQYFGMDICYFLVLFRIIQGMKMHLCTAFGVSTSFYSSNGQPF